MNLEVFNPWTLGFWALMAGAVAWLWRLGSSPTARWSLVGAVAVTVLGAVWANLEVRRSLDAQTNPDIRAFADNVQCVACRESSDAGGYSLTARLLNGAYSFSLARDFPYALRLGGGQALLDGQPLQVSGCASGTLPSSATLEFRGAREVRLEVGDNARC